MFTHSTERKDRVLAALQAALPAAERISDERRAVEPGEFPQRMPGTGAAMGVGTSAAMSRAERDEIVAVMERRWLEESVPALGGLIPLEAAADPSRREQVARLIDSFPELDGPAPPHDRVEEVLQVVGDAEALRPRPPVLVIEGCVVGPAHEHVDLATRTGVEHVERAAVHTAFEASSRGT